MPTQQGDIVFSRFLILRWVDLVLVAPMSVRSCLVMWKSGRIGEIPTDPVDEFLIYVLAYISYSYGGVEGAAEGFDYSVQDTLKTEESHAAMMDVDRAAASASLSIEQGCFLSTRNPNYSCGFPDPSSSATGHFLGQ